MITRFTIPIDILHDERIVALVADCGPQSIAVLISLHAILRRRGSVTRDRYLIAKIRHDLSFTLDEVAINAVIDHLIDSGYLQADGKMLRQEEVGIARQTEGRMGRLATSGNGDSINSTASSTRGGEDTPSPPPHAPSTPQPSFKHHPTPQPHNQPFHTRGLTSGPP